MKADEALSGIKDERLITKLLSIRAYENHTAKDIAAVFKTQTRTLFKWVELFRLYGVEGLIDKQKGHRQAILKQEHLLQIAKWLDLRKTPDGKDIFWTLNSLRQYIKIEFGLEIKKSALSDTLRKMDYTLRKPRPTHAKGSEEDRSAFKKKL